MALGEGVWQSVINRYDVPNYLLADLHGRRLYEHNVKVMDALLDGLT